MPCIGAARSATADRKRLFRKSRSVSSRAQRRSRCRGSSVNAPWSTGGAAVPSTPPAGFQVHVPSVTTGRIRSADLVASQYSSSLFTHSDSAASGDARSTNHSLVLSAVSIADHRCGLVDSPVSSRNTFKARRWFHGFASRCKPRCKAGANRPSAAWLYETNPSYPTTRPRLPTLYPVWHLDTTDQPAPLRATARRAPVKLAVYRARLGHLRCVGRGRPLAPRPRQLFGQVPSI